MGKVFRRLMYLLAALAAPCALAMGVMSTPWFRHYLERQVVQRIENLTGGRPEIGFIHFNPTVLKITFDGLTLRGAEAPGEPPFFSARTVVAQLSFASFIRRKLRLRSLEWDHAVVHLAGRPDGSSNLPVPQGAAGSVEALDDLTDLSIRRVNLSNTEIYLNDRRLPFELEAGNVAVTLRFSRPDSYSGNLSTNETRIRTSGLSLPPISFASQFSISRTRLEVNSLSWHAPGISGQGLLDLHFRPSPEGTFAYQAEGDVAKLAEVLGPPHLEGGRVTLQGQGNYQAGNLRSHGHVAVRELMLGSTGFRPRRVDLSADYSVDRRHVEFSNLEISGLSGLASGRVDVDLRPSTPKFLLQAQLRGLDWSRVLRALPGRQPAIDRLRIAAVTSGTASATWSGRFEDFLGQFNLRFRLPSGHAPNALPLTGTASGQARLDRNFFIDLRRAEFHSPHSTLVAQGRWGPPDSKLDWRVTTSDFEEWRPLVEYLAGAPVPLTLGSPATISGSAYRASGAMELLSQLSAGNFTYRDWRWDALEANFLARSDTLEVFSAELRRGPSKITGNVALRLDRWKLQPDSEVCIAAQAQRTPLEGLKSGLDFQVPLGGLVTGNLWLQGVPSSLDGRGDFRVEKGAFAQESFDSLSGEIHVEQSLWHVEKIELSKGTGRITGKIRCDPARRFVSAELHGADFRLADFKALSPSGRRSRKAGQLEGRLSFEVAGAGTPEAVHANSTWSVRDVSLNGQPFGDLWGKLAWQGNRIEISGQGQGSGGAVSFGGSVGADGGWPAQLTGQYVNFRADPWVRQFLNNKFDAQVTASGSFSIGGPLRDLSRLEARSLTQNLEIAFPGLAWKNTNPIELRYADGVLTASPFRLRGPSTDLAVEGSVGFREPLAISLSAQGQADAALLSLIDPQLRATGHSALKLRVAGSPAQPLLNGTLDVRDVSVSYGDLPIRLTGLNGVIRLEGERATMHGLQGASGGGTVTLTGFVILGGTPRYEVRAELDQVRVHYPTDFTSLLNGNLHLVGTSDRGLLSGELIVRQMFLSENFDLLSRMAHGSGLGGAELPGVASPVASRVQLNVQANSAPAVRLETHNLRLVADIDVRLQGTLARPVNVGTVQIRSGDAVFRGNRYRLNRGEISMTNPFRTQPVLDLEVQTRVQRYDLRLDVSGPLDRLKIAYRSDPPLPTADILSLLALGYTRQQEEMATAGSPPMPTVGASALLSEALSSQMTSRIQRLFGVSRVKIDPNVGGPGTTGGARVTVEQQVTRDFILTYVTNTASAQYRVIQFEWAMSENVSILGVRDQNGIFGLEFKLRQRFK